MTRFRLEMSQDVRDLLTHLPPTFKRKIKTALQSLAINPYQAKELKDDLHGLRSFRISQSRLIFRIQKHTIEIIAFGPRKDIYERVVTELFKTAPQPPQET